MADEKTVEDTNKEAKGMQELEEPRYIFPPHPEPGVALREEVAVNPETITAKDTLPDLIQEAMAGLLAELKVELKAELQTQVAEVKTELQKGVEADDKIKES